MIANYLGKVKRNHRGSSFVSPALGWAGQGRLFRSPLAKNFLAKPSEGGAGRKRGLGKRNSRPARANFRNRCRGFPENEF